MGFAASLARPGSNVTGISIDSGLAIVGKRVELIRELVPSSMRRLGYLAAPAPGATDGLFFRSSARNMNYFRSTHRSPRHSTGPAYSKAFARNGGTGRRVITRAGRKHDQPATDCDCALKARLATVFDTANNVEVGGLISYGIDFADVYRRCPTAKILAGTPPRSLPFPPAVSSSCRSASNGSTNSGSRCSTSLLARADNLVD